MIPADHEHVWQPYQVRPLGGGRQQIDSRCHCAGATVEDPGTVTEQRIIVDADGNPLSIMFRFGGMWFQPLDLLRLKPSTIAGPLEICSNCGGQPPSIDGIGPCPTCAGLGVTAAGAAVTAPALNAYS